MEILLIITNAIFGGGFLVTLVNLRSTKKKASSEAKAKELDNVQEAIAIWRETAEGMKDKIDKLECQVRQLARVNGQLINLFDKITPDNLEAVKAEVKKLHDEN